MGMPRLRAKSRSKAVYITGRSHSSAPAMITAVSAAALTVYDMCKALQRDMRIEHIRLLAKSGGRSGDFRAEEGYEWQS